jgi:hypothetical protein
MSLGFVGSPAALAQTTEAQPVIATFSQYLRATGHNLSAEEAVFLDADERIQAPFTLTMTNIQLLSRVDPAQRNDRWRQALVDELTRLLSLDPSASPPAPASLERVRELGIAQRTHVWRAARQWLDALQADDPEWLLRGDEEYRAALRDMSRWREELLARYPPPQVQP